METNITLIALGYLLARLGMLLTFVYIVYRVLRRPSADIRTDDRSQYAFERARASLTRR